MSESSARVGKVNSNKKGQRAYGVSSGPSTTAAASQKATFSIVKKILHSSLPCDNFVTVSRTVQHAVCQLFCNRANGSFQNLLGEAPCGGWLHRSGEKHPQFQTQNGNAALSMDAHHSMTRIRKSYFSDPSRGGACNSKPSRWRAACSRRSRLENRKIPCFKGPGP